MSEVNNINLVGDVLLLPVLECRNILNDERSSQLSTDVDATLADVLRSDRSEPFIFKNGIFSNFGIFRNKIDFLLRGTIIVNRMVLMI